MIGRFYLRVYVKIRILLLKMHYHFGRISFASTPNINDFSNVEVGNKSILTVGSGFTMRKNVALAVRDNAMLSIGSGVFINRNSIIMARQNITIADGVTIGPNVCIYDHDHDLCNRGGYLTDSVTIKQNVWIGANVIILKGVTIYENSVVSAGSIVTKDVPANTILIQKRTNTLINK